MIRYVHIGDQIDDDADDLAFYDTIAERWVSLGGVARFDGLEDLLEAARLAPEDLPPGGVERLVSLVPRGLAHRD